MIWTGLREKAKMTYKKELGKIGEKVAEEFLKSQGYKILDTNFRCRLGEIDIIAVDNEYIVFIEVKTRRSFLYGFPVESINKKKKNALVKVAQTYLNLKNLKDIDVRFDIVEVIIGEDNKRKIRLIKNAF